MDLPRTLDDARGESSICDLNSSLTELISQISERCLPNLLQPDCHDFREGNSLSGKHTFSYCRCRNDNELCALLVLFFGVGDGEGAFKLLGATSLLLVAGAPFVTAAAMRIGME